LLDRKRMHIDENLITLGLGMAVTVEIKTGRGQRAQLSALAIVRDKDDTLRASADVTVEWNSSLRQTFTKSIAVIGADVSRARSHAEINSDVLALRAAYRFNHQAIGVSSRSIGKGPSLNLNIRTHRRNFLMGNQILTIIVP
jgi:hypothetical protein